MDYNVNIKQAKKGAIMSIDERVFIYRAKNNLSQTEMAKKLSVSRELINKLENKKIEPSKMILVKMDLLEKGE